MNLGETRTAVKKTLLPDSPIARRRRNRAAGTVGVAATAALAVALSGCSNTDPAIPKEAHYCSSPNSQQTLFERSYNCRGFTVKLFEDPSTGNADVGVPQGNNKVTIIGDVLPASDYHNGNILSYNGFTIYVSGVNYEDQISTNSTSSSPYFNNTQVAYEQNPNATQSPQALGTVAELFTARPTQVYTFRRDTQISQDLAA